MPTPTGAARGLAAFTHDLTFERLPESVKRKAGHHIIDAIGLALASRAQPFAAPALRGIAAAGSPGNATVMGGSATLAPRDAAFSNGFLIHGLDFDDTHSESIVHPTVACLPTALAIAEEKDASWDTLLVAYAAGMEAAIRVGRAVNGGFHHVGFHATGIVSHFSSALIAGKLLDLNEAQLIAAQGITASTAAGVQVFLEEGAWTKRMHPGWGALSGITAAYLAQNDFAGPTRPYEGKFGLFDSHLQAHAKDVDVASISRDLGSEWTLLATSIKPYPVCHFIHGAAEAAIHIHAEAASQEQGKRSVEDIESVLCSLPAATLPIVAEPVDIKTRPRTDYDAKFSTQFVVAACLMNGYFGLSDLEPASLIHPGILALTAKVRCIADPDAAFPKYFSGRVVVRYKDGSELRADVPINLGNGDRALDESAIAAKFHSTAGLTLTTDRVDALLEVLLSPGRRSVRSVTALLRS